MNKIYSLFLSLLFVTIGHAQKVDPEDFPWIRIANATGLDGPIQIFIKGRNINPEGYESGVVTGAFSLYPGQLEVVVKHPLIEDSTFNLELHPSDRMALIVYTEPVEKKDDIVKKRVIKFSTLKRKSKSERKSATLLFLSVTKGIDLSMNDTLVSLTPHQQKDLSFGQSRGSQVNLMVKGRPLKTFDIDEVGDYAIIVFDKPDGTQGCITFNNTRI